MPTNVLGTELRCCCREPLAGFYRDGYCRTGPEDKGLHTVCAVMTRDFLDYSVLQGNDLVTPHPEWGFPGLNPGDRWCICVARWRRRSSAESLRRLIWKQLTPRPWNSSRWKICKPTLLR